ncbi:Hsp70 ATPase ssc1 [Allomyces arbusculus]|nr:Hsp70 ATPase ssc1 [Allomyces arbusculus]
MSAADVLAAPGAPPPGMGPARFSPYLEPSLHQLGVLASFLVVLNVVRIAFDQLFYAGLVGELLLGVVYGTPLADLLTPAWLDTFRVLGDLGLILVVFEGGLGIHRDLLLANLPLSTLAAMIGVLTPIALSVLLLHVAFGYPLAQALAAGAALSSTSLGTTFVALGSTVGRVSAAAAASTTAQPATEAPAAALSPASLNDSDIVPAPADPVPPPALTPAPVAAAAAADPITTRFGTVLISAALIDDVVGLVMLSIIDAASAAPSAGSEKWWTHAVVRPLVASVTLAAAVPALGVWVLRPVFQKWIEPWLVRTSGTIRTRVVLVGQLGVLAGLVTAAGKAGASNLLGAFLAGLLLEALPSEPAEMACHTRDEDEKGSAKAVPTAVVSFMDVFATTLGPLKEYILAPLFFSSMGSAIPFFSLWTPTILWRGLVYAVLMALGKFIVGPVVIGIDHFLLRCGRPAPPRARRQRRSMRPRSGASWLTGDGIPAPPPPPPPPAAALPAPTGVRSRRGTRDDKPRTPAPPPPPPPTFNPEVAAADPQPENLAAPAALLGLGLVARGEIGILIAQLAYSGGVTSRNDPAQTPALGEEPFLLATWAIVVCTVVGPLGMAALARRWWPRIAAGPWG